MVCLVLYQCEKFDGTYDKYIWKNDMRDAFLGLNVDGNDWVGCCCLDNSYSDIGQIFPETQKKLLKINVFSILSNYA